MGAEESKPPPPPPPTLLEKPWRNTRGWEEDARRELKEEVASLAPEIPEGTQLSQVPYYNILLTGQIKSGKSSFFNSLNNVFTERVVAKADVGKAAQSLTREFNIYNITKQGNELSWRICDTMGLDISANDECDVRNILRAVDGNIPDKFVFQENQEVVPDTPKYVKDPSMANRAHCVAVVVDASQLPVMSSDMWKKLRSLRKGLLSRKVPTFIILTHIDKACEEVNKDMTNVFHSVVMQELVESVGNKLLGLPENQVFPVRNYSVEVEMDSKMDILLLYALRQMLYAAQGHLENKM